MRDRSPGSPTRDPWFWGLGAVGLYLTVYSFRLLLDPEGWYQHEAGVPDFGPYNEHFVRDIGCALVTMGIVIGWAAWSRALRGALLGAAAVFFVAHALLHVYDTARGFVEADHWWIDLTAVYVPGILTPLLALYWLRRAARGSETRA